MSGKDTKENKDGKGQSSGACSINDDDFVEVDLSEPLIQPDPVPCGPKCFRILGNVPNLEAAGEEPLYGSYPRSIHKEITIKEECEECACGSSGKPCVFCQRMNYECDGICYCCEGHRKFLLNRQIKAVVKTEEHPITAEVYDSKFEKPCPACRCKGKESTCDTCRTAGWNCEGTCFCCLKYRQSVYEKLANQYCSTSLEDAAKGRLMCICNINPPSCSYCSCTVHKKPCDKCVEDEFICGGTCPCCEGFRVEQAESE